jgi:hypothetical protein
MPKVEQFPYEITEAEEKRITDTPKQLGNDDKPLHSIMFQQVEVTIERTWTGGSSVGFSFEEDVPMDNGYKIIWNMKSEWDDQANKPKPYKANDGKEGTPSDALTWVEGDRVKVALSRRDYWHKANQASTPKGVVAWGVKVGSSAGFSDAPAAPSRTNNQAAATGQVLNVLVALATAGMTEEIGVTQGAAYSIIKDAMIGNLEDRPLDLSTLHSLLVPVVAEESEESEESEDDVPQENVETLKW